jgi:murein DD-endopeptidase MepM/ murein hydrolase activator NlpD
MTATGRAYADTPAQTAAAAAEAASSAGQDANAVGAAASGADVHAVTSGLARALAEAQAETQRMAAAMATAQAERDAAFAAKTDVERRMASIEEGQVALLARLTEHAELRIGSAEASLRETGLDLDRILTELETSRFGRGGPMVALPELPPEAIPPVATEAMAQLEGKLERQARLRALFTLLPLSAPIDDFYVSSGFGKRRDPFTRSWAMHTGIDLVSQYRAPVAATAPGTVTKTGWEEGYGRMVEIDHGFGIRTRYAHLDQISVKEGAQLNHGEQVGTLGNTGRSSGPHVHYEVLVDGRPVDPLRFMEKSRYVCEG